MSYLTTIFTLCWCLGISMVMAQDTKLNPAPENHVLDTANLFREQPAKLAEITASLRAIEEKHGYHVYLAVYYDVLDSSLQERADQLYEDWLGEEKRGLVIVTQLDPAMDGKVVATSYYRATGLEVGVDKNLIPDRDMQNLCTKALSVKEDGHAEWIKSMMLGVEREMDAYYAVKPSKWNDSGNLKMMAVLIGAIFLFLILGMFLWKMLNRADVKSSQNYYFPEVEIAQRLGASYGGGWISEKNFPPSSSRG